MSTNSNSCGIVAFGAPQVRIGGDCFMADLTPEYTGEDIFANLVGGIAPWDLTKYGREKNTILGSYNSEKIRGSNSDDIIFAYSGNDRIYGYNGDDTIYGGFGNDKLYGGNGDDALYGGLGRDYLYGGDGDDTLIIGADGSGLYGEKSVAKGEEGNDTFYVWGNRHYINGADGDDKVYVMQRYPIYDPSETDDYALKLTIKTGDGSDLVYGNIEESYIHTGEGSDVLEVTGNNNKIYTGNGSDTVTIIGDHNYLRADSGSGEDKICIDGDKNQVRTGDDNDEVTVAMYSYENKIETGNDNDVITLESYTYANEVYAGKDDDTIYINEGSAQNMIKAYNGDDTIYAHLSGGSIGNVFRSGTGNDTYVFETVGVGGSAVIYGDNRCDYKKTFDVVEFGISRDEADALGLDVLLNDNTLILDFEATASVPGNDTTTTKLGITSWQSGNHFAIDAFDFNGEVLTTEEFLLEYGIV